MTNLFWKTKEGTRALLDKPFGFEDEFERMVFSTSELLKDIFLLKRQIRGGNKVSNLDIFWLKDDALEESANLPAPEVIAREISDDLGAALEQFAAIAEDLKK